MQSGLPLVPHKAGVGAARLAHERLVRALLQQAPVLHAAPSEMRASGQERSKLRCSAVVYCKWLAEL